MPFQIDSSDAAVEGGEGLHGVVVGSPKALPQEVQAALPTDHAAPVPPPPQYLFRAQKLEILRSVPPEFCPRTLPPCITILEPYQLRNTEAVGAHRALLVKVGGGTVFLT